jgi:hypothetical protein
MYCIIFLYIPPSTLLIEKNLCAVSASLHISYYIVYRVHFSTFVSKCHLLYFIHREIPQQKKNRQFS